MFCPLLFLGRHLLNSVSHAHTMHQYSLQRFSLNSQLILMKIIKIVTTRARPTRCQILRLNAPNYI